MALLDMPLRTMWSEVQDVRDKVEALLADLPPEAREATVMTASELVENAIKYGESVPAAPNATVSLHRDGDVVRVVVRNGAASEAGARDLLAHIERLSAADDRMALYLARLRELMTSPGGSSRLGIYRIGCEGGFDLAGDYTDRVITVTATRRIEGGAS